MRLPCSWRREKLTRQRRLSIIPASHELEPLRQLVGSYVGNFFQSSISELLQNRAIAGQMFNLAAARVRMSWIQFSSPGADRHCTRSYCCCH